jgi:hypothetical protein
LLNFSDQTKIISGVGIFYILHHRSTFGLILSLKLSKTRIVLTFDVFTNEK